MKLLLKRPNTKLERTFAAAQAGLPLSYPEVGYVLGEDFPDGYDHDRNEGQIGQGRAAFAAARLAIQEFRHFPGGWAFARPAGDDPPAAGQNIAVSFYQFGLWWLNGCRVLKVIDRPDIFGFSYGTLTSHVERGEELFYTRIDDRQRVFYGIKAYSWPRFWGARLLKPYARRQQRRFVRDSTARMERIVHGHEA